MLVQWEADHDVGVPLPWVGNKAIFFFFSYRCGRPEKGCCGEIKRGCHVNIAWFS